MAGIYASVDVAGIGLRELNGLLRVCDATRRTIRRTSELTSRNLLSPISLCVFRATLRHRANGASSVNAISAVATIALWRFRHHRACFRHQRKSPRGAVAASADRACDHVRAGAVDAQSAGEPKRL